MVIMNLSDPTCGSIHPLSVESVTDLSINQWTLDLPLKGVVGVLKGLSGARRSLNIHLRLAVNQIPTFDSGKMMLLI